MEGIIRVGMRDVELSPQEDVVIRTLVEHIDQPVAPVRLASALYSPEAPFERITSGQLKVVQNRISSLRGKISIQSPRLRNPKDGIIRTTQGGYLVPSKIS
jgi:hypothetical protein